MRLPFCTVSAKIYTIQVVQDDNPDYRNQHDSTHRRPGKKPKSTLEKPTFITNLKEFAKIKLQSNKQFTAKNSVTTQ